MTVNDIVGELQGTRPRASDALRLQVMTLASRPTPHTPSLLERLRGGRRALVLVPTAAALAVAAAVVIGVTRSGPPATVEATAPDLAERAADGAAEALTGPAASAPSAADATRAKAPAPTVGRAQRYSAALTLEVADDDALSDATKQALAIASELGGHLVSVHYATADEGAASLTLRVPSARAADAVTRLSSLGTILAQDVQIDDLQESLDALGKQVERVQARIAALGVAIEKADDLAERARLEAERSQARSALAELRRTRTATATEARTATIQLDLRTTPDIGAVVPGSGSRLDRALDKALAVLAWEAVVLLAVAIALAPVALVAAAVWATRRTRRRREEERLLAAS